jgi:predicted enzyme related to lactoylglutathione lyase
MQLPTVPGAPVWVDLYTSDPAGAAAFYGGLFGWTAQDSDAEHGGYVTFHHEGGPIAGCVRNDGTSGDPNSWSVYLESSDAAATVSMAEANGGRIVVEPRQVDDLGHLAFVTDPAGAMVGIWQPGSHAGIAARDVVGAPVWFELLTTDFEESVRFYENVFGWATSSRSDTDEFRYTTLGRDEDAVAGIMDASAFLGDALPTWSVYFEVEDVDETVREAEEAGGAIVMAPDDSPYGRLAELQDPAGARFKILGPNLESA